MTNFYKVLQTKDHIGVECACIYVCVQLSVCLSVRLVNILSCLCSSTSLVPCFVFSRDSLFAESSALNQRVCVCLESTNIEITCFHRDVVFFVSSPLLLLIVCELFGFRWGLIDVPAATVECLINGIS